MRWAKFGYIAGGVLSVAVHVFAFGGLSAMKKSSLGTQHVAVMMSSAKKKQKPKPLRTSRSRSKRRKEMLVAPARCTAKSRAAAGRRRSAARSDRRGAPGAGCNAEISASICRAAAWAGPGGIAVPMGGPGAALAAERRSPHKEKTFGAAAWKRPTVAAGRLPRRPGQSEAARLRCSRRIRRMRARPASKAAFECKLRCWTRRAPFSNTKIVSGLGHGTDESAIAAARRMSFSPATRCGKAVPSPSFVISVRFALGD